MKLTTFIISSELNYNLSSQKYYLIFITFYLKSTLLFKKLHLNYKFSNNFKKNVIILRHPPPTSFLFSSMEECERYFHAIIFHTLLTYYYLYFLLFLIIHIIHAYSLLLFLITHANVHFLISCTFSI
jgi:hypothetical protein